MTPASPRRKPPPSPRRRSPVPRRAGSPRRPDSPRRRADSPVRRRLDSPYRRGGDTPPRRRPVSPGRGRSPSPPRRLRSPARLAFNWTHTHTRTLTISLVKSTQLYIISVGCHLEGCVEAQVEDVHLHLLPGAGNFIYWLFPLFITLHFAIDCTFNWLPF